MANNRSQAARLPKAVVRPDEVERVDIIAAGKVGIITLAGEAWNSWFDSAEESARPARSLADIEGFAVRLDTLDSGREAAAQTGPLGDELALAGRPIGPHDQMIACRARALGLVLVANHRGEFARARTAGRGLGVRPPAAAGLAP